jgi:hypothetical protein
METKTLYKNWFRKELMNMAASCVGLKPATAKKKADKIFEKYDSIISGSSNYNSDYHQKQCREAEEKFNILKNGSISYSRGEMKGKLLLKDIEQIEVRKTDVLLITKTGREITMGLDFKYLKDLF